MIKSILDKKNKEKIVVLTAYDYPSAKVLDESGVDIILVGDSLGMTVMGYDTTLPVTMEDMLHHTKAVTRAVNHALVVADMPFGSYDHPEQALSNAQLLLKDGEADAVKMEGGKKIQAQVKALTELGIPVMGHVGMLPQSIEKTSGYKVQGRSPEEAQAILEDAKILDALGVFAIVIECVPQELAARITRTVKCPTIGIGAGPMTDGQVLVFHDMMGFEGKVSPKFVKKFASIEKEMKKAVAAYCEEVKNGTFPGAKESF